MISTTEESRRVALDLMEAMGRGDAARIDELLAEDLVWWTPGMGHFTREFLIESSKSMNAAKRAIFEVVATTAENERVAVEARSDFLFEPDVEYANTYHFLFIVREGKVVRGHEYLDTALAARVFPDAPAVQA